MAATPTIVLSGPSGSGKSTLLNKAMTQYPEKFAFGISHTTRSPRPGEIDGVHYNFTDIPTMKKMIENGDFYEYTDFTGNLYGTSKKTVKDIQNSGKVCVLDVDLQGVRSFKQSSLVAKYIFIAPPGIEVLKVRLKERGTETEESIAHRIKRAEEDMKAVKENAGLFDYVVVNDELDEAYEKFMNVINEEPSVRKALLLFKEEADPNDPRNLKDLRRLPRTVTELEADKSQCAMESSSSQDLRTAVELESADELHTAIELDKAEADKSQCAMKSISSEDLRTAIESESLTQLRTAVGMEDADQLKTAIELNENNELPTAAESESSGNIYASMESGAYDAGSDNSNSKDKDGASRKDKR